ncbi:MAG: hypothetical protein JNL10_11985 [Verrucomicrobiales bacterium]|nr:hypothetical protein [Verrucomicrobiales bacterium]
MIHVLALTQLAFLTLGVVLTRILYRAHGNTVPSEFVEIVIHQWYWLFAAPLVWIAFAKMSEHFNRFPFTVRVAQGLGVSLAVVAFLFFVGTSFRSYP